MAMEKLSLYYIFWRSRTLAKALTFDYYYLLLFRRFIYLFFCFNSNLRKISWNIQHKHTYMQSEQ